MSESVKDAFNHNRHRWLDHVARDRKLSGGALRVAIVLWQRMNAEYGYAWPGLDHLAEELSIHKATVIRAIQQLEGRGLITVERGGGRKKSNKYRPSFGLAVLDEIEAEENSRIPAKKGRTVAKNRVAQALPDNTRNFGSNPVHRAIREKAVSEFQLETEQLADLEIPDFLRRETTRH